MVKVKGSKDGKQISARFEGQSKSLFPSLKDTRALVLLSIKGNEYCTGDYLKAIIQNACANHQFTTFLIADEVYWHNLVTDSSNHDCSLLKQHAREMGQTYFEENFIHFLSPLNISMNEFDSSLVTQMPVDKQSTLNNLARKTSNFEVLFWSDWLNCSQVFNDKKTEIMALYETEEILHESIEYTSQNFAKRHHSDNESMDLLLKRSSNYLIEESPAVMWIAASLDYNFIIYPGEIIKPFKATRDYFVRKINKQNDDNNDLLIKKEKPQLLINWLEVSFQRSHEKHHLKEKPCVITLDSVTNKEQTTAMIRGATEAIFAMNIDNKEKINLLTDLLINFQSKQHSFS